MILARYLLAMFKPWSCEPTWAQPWSLTPANSEVSQQLVWVSGKCVQKVLACSAGECQAEASCAPAADIMGAGQVGCTQQDASQQEESQQAAACWLAGRHYLTHLTVLFLCNARRCLHCITTVSAGARKMCDMHECCKTWLIHCAQNSRW